MVDRDIKDFTFIPISSVKKRTTVFNEKISGEVLASANAYDRGWNDCVDYLLNKKNVTQFTVTDLIPIHCEECKHWDKDSNVCSGYGFRVITNPRGFCSYGDLKDED